MEAITERLARALEAAGAPPAMVEKARRGGYDDYQSESPTPILDLVRDCRAHGLDAIARRAMDGEFDATAAEADAWAASPEGQAAVRRLRGLR